MRASSESTFCLFLSLALAPHPSPNRIIAFFIHTYIIPEIYALTIARLQGFTGSLADTFSDTLLINMCSCNYVSRTGLPY